MYNTVIRDEAPATAGRRRGPAGQARRRRAMDGVFRKMRLDCRRPVEDMIDGIGHMCRDMEQRAPGSAGEREAAEHLARVLRTECGCDDVRLETFRPHPAAFYGYFWFSMAFDVLCALLYFEIGRAHV